MYHNIVEIYVDETAISDPALDTPVIEGFVTLIKEQNDKSQVVYAVALQNGAVVKVTVIDADSPYLLFSTILPDTFKDQTQGMMGNFDGDSTNDLQDPDGAAPTDTTDEEIFNTMKLWQTTAVTSKFVYPGKTQ